MKKEGFTLVELLAVIAILAILVIVAMPNVLGMFNQAKMNSFVTEVQKIMDTATVTFTKDALLNSGKTVYYSSAENATLRTKKLDMSGNEKNYFIEMNRNGEFKRVVVYDANYCYDIYTNDSNAKYGTSQSKLIDDKISKTSVLVGDLWESGNDSVDIAIDGEKYIVSGCTGILASGVEDTTAPTCKLKATTSGVTFESKTDNVGITLFGLVKSTTPTYNGTNTLELSNGTFYGYVKDRAGNTGSCSITIGGTYLTSNYSKTTRTCNYSAVSYTQTVRRCNRTVSSYTQTRKVCHSSITNYSVTMKRCNKTQKYNVYTKTCLNNGGTYAFGAEVLSTSGATSCTSSSITCNAANVGNKNIRCQDASSYYFTYDNLTQSSCSVGSSFTCDSSNYGRTTITSCSPNYSNYWTTTTSSSSSCGSSGSFTCNYSNNGRSFVSSCAANYNYNWTNSTYTVSNCAAGSTFTCDSSNYGRSYVASCSPHNAYNWRSTVSTVTSCSVGTSFTCNSTTVGNSFVSGCARLYACNDSGFTKINNTYCYKY